jgi:hypothetical protein
MQADELDFLEDMLQANELLRCVICHEETLHAHEKVLAAWLHATELRMQCTSCGTSRAWLQAHRT